MRKNAWGALISKVVLGKLQETHFLLFGRSLNIQYFPPKSAWCQMSDKSQINTSTGTLMSMSAGFPAVRLCCSLLLHPQMCFHVALSMIGVFGHDSAMLRLYWAGDNLGK